MTTKLRTRLVQMDVIPGQAARNTAVILEHIQQAQKDRVRLLVFPEMAIPGYLIGDEWECESFLRECERGADEIRAAARRLIVIFGGVGVDWTKHNEDGRVRKFNALFVAHNGRFLAPSNSPFPFVIKTLHPNYRQFDDSRHFYDLRKLALERRSSVERLTGPVIADGLRLGCVICEDAWDTDYGVSPLRILNAKGVDMFINISSSPFTLNKNSKRRRLFSAHARHLTRPIVYVNNVGIQNNGKTAFVFDGSSCIYDNLGNQLVCGEPFETATLTSDIPTDGSARFTQPVDTRPNDVADMHRAIEYGTRRFMELCNVRRVVVGVSGGIDSAVVAALYRRLLKARDLLLINMPGPFTSPTTIGLARRLAANLGCLYKEIPIRDGVNLTRHQVNRLAVTNSGGTIRQTLKLTDFMFENVQSRDRGSRLLSAVAAAFGGVFTCNANKSEVTVGYSTFYGDLCGYFANIADLWKTEVYHLARHLNTTVYRREVIPDGILQLTPSAELSPAQNVDEGKGDPLNYPYHDLLFRTWVESWNRVTIEEILEWYSHGILEESLGYAGRIADLFPSPAAFIGDLERWWNQYKGMGQIKRVQAPPILAVTRRAFGFDHREAIMTPVCTRRYHELKATLLALTQAPQRRAEGLAPKPPHPRRTERPAQRRK